MHLGRARADDRWTPEPGTDGFKPRHAYVTLSPAKVAFT